MSKPNALAGNVIVACRVRPLNKSEIARGAACCMDFHSDKKKIDLIMSEASVSAMGTNKFVFDRVFDTVSQQQEVYDYTARPIID